MTAPDPKPRPTVCTCRPGCTNKPRPDGLCRAGRRAMVRRLNRSGPGAVRISPPKPRQT